MKKWVMRLSLAMTLSPLLAGVGAAQGSPHGHSPEGVADAPTVDSLIAAALSRSPSLAELRARVRAARERARGAGALPRPMLELMLQDVGFPSYTVGEEDMSMIGPQLTQAIPFPGKRGARQRAAQADASVRERALEALECVVVRDVRVLAARLYALDAEEQALLVGRDVLGQLAASAGSRYSTGSAGSEPLLQARLAQHRLAERLDDLRAERAQAGAALALLTDSDPSSPEGALRALPGVPAIERVGSDTLALRSTELAVRHAESRSAEAQWQAVRLERLPDLVAGAGVGFRGSHDPVVTLRLGLDLPLWGGGEKRANARAAEQDVFAARAAERGALLMARTEQARLRTDLGLRQAQAARYRDQIVPDSRLAFESARSSYLVGRGELSAVLSNFNSWLEATTGLARREAEIFANWAELEHIENRAAIAITKGGSK